MDNLTCALLGLFRVDLRPNAQRQRCRRTPPDTGTSDGMPPRAQTAPKSEAAPAASGTRRDSTADYFDLLIRVTIAVRILGFISK